MPDAATETFNAKRASLVYTLKDINGSTLAALVVSVVPGRAGNPCLNNACVVREGAAESRHDLLSADGSESVREVQLQENVVRELLHISLNVPVQLL